MVQQAGMGIKKAAVLRAEIWACQAAVFLLWSAEVIEVTNRIVLMNGPMSSN